MPLACARPFRSPPIPHNPAPPGYFADVPQSFQLNDAAARRCLCVVSSPNTARTSGLIAQPAPFTVQHSWPGGSVLRSLLQARPSYCPAINSRLKELLHLSQIPCRTITRRPILMSSAIFCLFSFYATSRSDACSAPFAADAVHHFTSPDIVLYSKFASECKLGSPARVNRICT